MYTMWQRIWSLKLRVRNAIQQDAQLQKLMSAIQSSWCQDSYLSIFVYFKEELRIADGVVLRNHRLVVLLELQKRITDITHHKWQRIIKMKQLNREKVWLQVLIGLWKKLFKLVVHVRRQPLLQFCMNRYARHCYPLHHGQKYVLNYSEPFMSGDYVLAAIDE